MSGFTLKPAAHDPFAGPKLAAFVPVTDAQREVWLAAMMQADANLSYNEGNRLRLRGALDVDKLAAALQTLVDRHEPLRSTFSPDGRWMCVLEKLAVELPVFEIAADVERGLAEHESAEMKAGFDLERGPLIRLRLLRAGPDLHYLMLTAHHIVCDGWSVAVLFTELGALYSAAVEGRALTLDPAPRYGDYTVLEHSFTASADGRAHEQYWLDLLTDAPPPVDIPGDRMRPAQRSFAASRIDYPLSPELVTRLRKTGAEFGASLVATTLATFAVLLCRLTGARDLVIGLAAAGQSFHGQKMLVGHCVNLLPLRLRPDPAQPFADFLRATRAAVLDAFDHQGSTFGNLVAKLKLNRDESRPPLISTIFNIDVRDDDIRHAGLEVDYATMVRRADNFEFYVNMVDNGRDLLLECAYSTALFSEDAIRARLGEYETLLEAICRAPQTPIADLPLMTADERRKVVETWNASRREHYFAGLLDKPLHHFIDEQSARTPDAPALIAENETLSYAELERRSNRLAQHLVAQGVGPDAIVAVCAQRGVGMVVALLAVLKAGGAYLPLDPAYPAERLAFMLQDSQARLVLADLDESTELSPETRATLSGSGVPTFDLQRDAGQLAALPMSAPTVAVQPQNLAYVIYTSGSTGKPKGALLEHRGIVNRLLWMQDEYGLREDDRVLQKTPYSFDVSVWEFFWPLMTGATLVLAKPEGHKDPAYLADLILREGVTICHFVPPMLAAFLPTPGARLCRSLKRVFASGEALPYPLTQAFYEVLPHATLHNLYGPTEASVDVSYWPCVRNDPRARVPIGRPVANTQLYVLDGSGQPLPAGVAGELHLGGVQLARGYLNREELTRQKFVQHPEFGRLYRTGDLARWLDDGVVEYLGRLDFQVKLRGFRVELGEIEAALLSDPRLAEVFVNVLERAPGDQRLVAWLVWKSAADTLTASEMRAVLRRHLPDYMIPQYFLELPKLPLSANGKLDRRALPSPFEERAAVTRTPPRDEAERFVAETWSVLLGLEAQAIGIEDRFFDLGGHSLLAVQAAARLQKRFGRSAPLRVAMMDPLAQVAAVYAATDAPPAVDPAPAPVAPVDAAPVPGVASIEVESIASEDEEPGLIRRLGRWLGKRA